MFILLVRNQKRFKWWFEGVDRVLRNHQFDIMCLKLEEEGIEKYTRGYMCQSEIVFMMKGLVPHSNCPIICIMKVRRGLGLGLGLGLGPGLGLGLGLGLGSAS